MIRIVFTLVVYLVSQLAGAQTNNEKDMHHASKQDEKIEANPKNNSGFSLIGGDETKTISIGEAGIGKNQNDDKFSIEVTVPNVSSSEGVVLAALYNSNESMFKREPLAALKSKIENGSASVVFTNVEPGEYAVVCLHDKNMNERMDFDANGMPLEDYGSSNNPMQMGPPNYYDAKFKVENKSLALTIRF